MTAHASIPPASKDALPPRLSAGRALFAGPWFAYTTIFLLQVHRMWGVWDRRELPGGDTCAYFLFAYRWLTEHRTNFAWSPLYTSFYALVLHLINDVAVATALHRLLIAVAATLLVLAVLRRLLPPEIAWLAAAWWAVMPINFDTMYEVHLFAVIPILVAWLVALSGRGPWARGTALALLMLSAMLVRNELLIAAGAFAAVCVVWEIAARRRGAGRRGGTVAAAYLLPLLLAFGVIGFFYARSYVRGAALSHEMDEKHSVNMGQVYAYGYQQRHPEWRKSPWTQYAELTRRDFGTVHPSLAKMLRRNPLAFARHVWWNLRLVPAGVQIMLFNATGAHVSPDYVNTHLAKSYPLPLTIVVLACVGLGLVLFWREREFWWQDYVRPRIIGWLCMLCVVIATALVVIPTQRPRPSYLFSVTIFLMAVVGGCVVLVIARWSWLRRLRPLMPTVMIGLVVFIPGFYARPHKANATPIRDDYERLRPHQALFTKPGAVFVGIRPVEMHNYIGLGRPEVYGYDVLARVSRQSLREILAADKATLLELDGAEYRRLESDFPGCVETLGDDGGWQLVGFSQAAGGSWMLLSRAANSASLPPSSPWSPGLCQLSGFWGWVPVSGWQEAEGPYPSGNPPFPLVRWGLAPSSRFVVRASRSGRSDLRLEALSPVGGQRLAMKIDGLHVGDFPIPHGTFGLLSIPLDLAAGDHEIEFSYARWQDVGVVRQAVLFKRLEWVTPEVPASR